MEMIILTNNSVKEEVNVSKMYGTAATLSKDNFLKNYSMKETRAFHSGSRRKSPQFRFK